MATLEIVLGSIAGICSIISGTLIKLHLSRSTCTTGKGMCFGCDCICDDEEIDVVEKHRELKRENSKSNYITNI